MTVEGAVSSAGGRTAKSAGRAPADKPFTITDLSREFDITPRTLRHYEAEGLIHPERRGSTRLYSATDRARVQWILRGRAVGFSLTDIRELLDLYAPGRARRDQMQATLVKCRAHVAHLEAKRASIDATILEINRFCSTVEDKLQLLEND